MLGSAARPVSIKGSAAKDTAKLIRESRSLVNSLWGSFRVLPQLQQVAVAEEEGGAGESSSVTGTGTGTGSGGGNDAETVGDDDGPEEPDANATLASWLFPLLADDAFELHLDVRNIDFSLRKAPSLASAATPTSPTSPPTTTTTPLPVPVSLDSVRLALAKQHRFEQDRVCAAFSMRFNLGETSAGSKSTP